MADLPDKPYPRLLAVNVPPLVGSERAPFIFFDGATSYGIGHGGVVQIELVAHTIIPVEGGGVRTESVVTAHLRCSEVAIRDLKAAIDGALFMLEKPAGSAN